MEEEKGLSARELLERVYGEIKKNGREFELIPKVKPRIAKEPGPHRIRIGYIEYGSVTVLKVGWKEWVIALGTRNESYPGDQYDCDIVAREFLSSGKTNEEIVVGSRNVLEESNNFWNSIIVAMVDGRLGLGAGVFNHEVSGILESRIQEFVAKDMKIDSRYFTANLRPIVESPIQYKPEFVYFLYGMFLSIMR